MMQRRKRTSLKFLFLFRYAVLLLLLLLIETWLLNNIEAINETNSFFIGDEGVIALSKVLMVQIFGQITHNGNCKSIGNKYFFLNCFFYVNNNIWRRRNGNCKSIGNKYYIIEAGSD